MNGQCGQIGDAIWTLAVMDGGHLLETDKIDRFVWQIR